MPQNLSHQNYLRLRQEPPVSHVPPGSQPTGATVTLKLAVAAHAAPEVVLTDRRRGYTWRVAMHAGDQDDVWEAEILLPEQVTIITYYFFADGRAYEERRMLESQDSEFGNRPAYGEWTTAPYRLAVYDPQRMPAEWTRGMVVYQIFPDRFAKSQSDESAIAAMKGVYGHEPMFKAWGDVPEDPPLGRDFFGGDLRGLIEKLDYLAGLGVECVYLNPIFEASSNHRYEAIDFLRIDRMLGTEADFDELIQAAHQRGIKIVLDAVFNHCSSDSVYFDITGKFGDGAAQSRQSPYYRWFKFSKWPKQFDGWMGLGFMPEFVETPEMVRFFVGAGGITEHWLNKGIDGWRADVPFDNTDWFWTRFNERVAAVKPEAWTIAEEWRDASNYLLGDMFNATMNYRLAWAVRGFFAMQYLSASEFDDRLFVLRADTPAPALHSQMNLLDSHDTDRLLTACGGNRQRFMQAFAFLFAYPGAPTIFYGTEAGLTGKFPEDSRRCMMWDDLDAELGEYFRKIMTLRHENDILRYGDFAAALIDDDKRLYGMARRLDGRAVYAVFNAGREPSAVTLNLQPDEGGTWRDLLGGLPPQTAHDGALTFELPAHGSAWLTQS